MTVHTGVTCSIAAMVCAVVLQMDSIVARNVDETVEHAKALAFKANEDIFKSGKTGSTEVYIKLIASETNKQLHANPALDVVNPGGKITFEVSVVGATGPAVVKGFINVQELNHEADARSFGITKKMGTHDLDEQKFKAAVNGKLHEIQHAA